MRVYTPVPAISRDIVSPMTVEGVDIPKGVVMEVNILHVHNNIHLWDKPTVGATSLIPSKLLDISHIAGCFLE